MGGNEKRRNRGKKEREIMKEKLYIAPDDGRNNARNMLSSVYVTK
jgi:hypothetical protein